MRVDLRGAHIGVAELLLYRADVRAAFEQVRCEGMAQRVAARRLVNVCAQHGRAHRLLHAAFVHMVPALLAGLRVDAVLCSGEDILPAPLEGRIWVLTSKRIGEKSGCTTLCPITFERRAACEQVPPQGGY